MARIFSCPAMHSKVIFTVVSSKGVTMRPIYRLLIASGLMSAGFPFVAHTAAPAATTQPATATPAYDALDQYGTSQINGWTVLISKRLMKTKDAILIEAVLRKLDHQRY